MKTDRFLLEELQKIHSILKQDSAFEFQFSEIDLLELLNHVICERVFYFKSKYENFSFLGLGHSKSIKAIDLQENLDKNSKEFYVASLIFEADPNASELYLPEWIFISRNKQTELFINKSSEYNTYSAPQLYFNTNFDLNLYDPFIPEWLSYDELPEHDEWAEMIEKSDELFDSGELEKIVLSRKKIFEYMEPIDPIVFFKAVMEKNNSNSSYNVFYQMNFNKAFISLTPEKLFSIEDNHFESISLAASAPRGKTFEEDQEFEAQLSSSDKLKREHDLVTAEIVKKLKPYSNNISVSPAKTMKLSYIQHQSTPITAELLSKTNPIELISLLHPTPAVGGLPWDKAKYRVSELEPYARDQYAAPIGVLSAHYSEMAVGIRSALIESTKLSIYGGAGIVKGSLAEEEWVETGIKMNPFLKVVNHE